MELKRWENEQDFIFALCRSIAVAGNSSGHVLLFDTENQEKLDDTYLPPGDAISFAKYSPDGASIALATEKGRVYIPNSEDISDCFKGNRSKPILDLSTADSKSTKSGITCVNFGSIDLLAVADTHLYITMISKVI